MACGSVVDGSRSPSKVDVGSYSVQQAFGTSTMPLMRPSTGAVPRMMYACSRVKPNLVRYFEGWYDPRRLHSKLGYLAPAHYEAMTMHNHHQQELQAA
jgi:hypothetical protein